jgi:hypothetical protein
MTTEEREEESRRTITLTAIDGCGIHALPMARFRDAV